MKKLDTTWKCLIIIAFIFIMQFLVVIFVNNVIEKSNLYPMTTVVTELNQEKDEVICIDFNGNEWVFDGVEDWLVGDIASMIIDDCGTTDIHDDKIVSVKYDGWF